MFFFKWGLIYLLKYCVSENIWFRIVSLEKKLIGLVLSTPGRSVVCSSAQMTSELYSGALQSSNHIV